MPKIKKHKSVSSSSPIIINNLHLTELDCARVLVEAVTGKPLGKKNVKYKRAVALLEVLHNPRTFEDARELAKAMLGYGLADQALVQISANQQQNRGKKN